MVLWALGLVLWGWGWGLGLGLWALGLVLWGWCSGLGLGLESGAGALGLHYQSSDLMDTKVCCSRVTVYL